MPSYSSYMRQMSVLDKDDDIVSWITVKGNHIPIMKGQSKEDAVKSFLESKGNGGKTETKSEHKTVQGAMGQTWSGVKLEGKYHQFNKKEDAEKFVEKAIQHGSKKEDIEIVGFEPSKEKQETDNDGVDSEIKEAFEDFPKFKIKKDYAVAENDDKRVVVEKYSDGVIGVTTETEGGELLNSAEFKSWESAATYANKQRILHKISLGEDK